MILDSYNCGPLVYDADFEVPISKNVFWVPVSKLGKPRYKNHDIQSMVNLSPEQKKDCIQNLYEAVQLFINSQFKQSMDVKYIFENGVSWEIHKPGYWAVKTNHGCCSSDAAWLRYILDGKYEEMGYFSLSRPTGSGHVYNYFKIDQWFYLYDLFPLTQQKLHHALKESGKKIEYIKSEYMTGILIKCKSLEDYAHYFARIQMTKNFDHMFFRTVSKDVSPIAVNQCETYIEICFPLSTTVFPILYKETPSIKFKKIPDPKIKIDWSLEK